MREPRLGDDIDDFCVRCKRVMNHNIVSVISGAPAKVRCRTCHSDHDFRNEQAPPPKVDLRKQALFTEVLKKVNPGGATVEVDLEIGGEIEPEAEAEVAEPAVAEVAEAAAAEAAQVAEVAEAKPAPRPKKAKGRPRK
jgi:hypothetical protein